MSKNIRFRAQKRGICEPKWYDQSVYVSEISSFNVNNISLGIKVYEFLEKNKSELHYFTKKIESLIYWKYCPSPAAPKPKIEKTQRL